MSRWVLLMSIVSGAVGQSMDETLDHISLLQTNAQAVQSRAHLEKKTDFSLAPQGWLDAFLQENSKTDLTLAPQGWSDAQNMKMDVSLRLAPQGFSNATDKMDHEVMRSRFFDDCGMTLHHVTECTQCNINFCASGIWQTNAANAEAGFTVGSSVPLWGCDNMPANPYVIRNSGSGAIYVAAGNTGLATSTLHHVTECNQCDVSFCGSSLWKKNSAYAEAGYSVGGSLPDWGCSNLPANPYVVRNSGTGAIYVAEMPSAGTLHHVTDCNQCGYNFCYESRWKQNSANAVSLR
jgi:predicted nucleic acid binding AN1-type Zn finger protein